MTFKITFEKWRKQKVTQNTKTNHLFIISTIKPLCKLGLRNINQIKLLKSVYYKLSSYYIFNYKTT